MTDMQITKTHKIITGVIAVIILFGLSIFFDRKSRQNTEVAEMATTTETVSGTKIVTQGIGGYTIEQIPLSGGTGVPQPIPDLNRPVTSSDSAKVSTDAIVLATQKILSLQAKLKGDPYDVSAWSDLGMYQKMAGDYQGTVISWEYVSKLTPTSYIPLGNLADLYAHFIKDGNKAEMYYKQAISKAPTQGYLYVGLAELYRDIFGNMQKARGIIEQGLKVNPSDPVLLQMKSNL